MRRTTLAIAGALACTALIFSASAAAKSSPKSCTTMSENVVGNTVKGTLSASNVNSVQAKFATCGHAKKVMNRVTNLRVEEPTSVATFYCRPVVTSTSPDVVSYTCTFKGADTPMFVKLTFKVKYNLD